MQKKRLAQIQQFIICAEKRHQEEQADLCSNEIYPLRYCLVVLSEGKGETQARRFLTKINVKPIKKMHFISHKKNLVN